MNRRIQKIKIGATVIIMSAIMSTNLILPTFATEESESKQTLTLEELNKKAEEEHPNKPEGSWEIKPPTMSPPSYVGHIHKPIPFVNGKLAVNMDRLDRTNSQIEFSIDKNWLGGRKIKRIGFASIRWYGFAIDNAGLYEANTFDNEWTIKIFTNSKDFNEITDKHESKDRYFWVKPTFDLFYEWSNDIVFMVQLEDGIYYNGRVRFKLECMVNWYPGKDCRAKSYDETKTDLNVIYEAHDAPKKYMKGSIVKESEGYANNDDQIHGNENDHNNEETGGGNGGSEEGSQEQPKSGDNSQDKPELKPEENSQKQPDVKKQENDHEQSEQKNSKSDKKQLEPEELVLAAQEINDGKKENDSINDNNEKTTVEVEESESDLSAEDKEDSLEDDKNGQKLSEVPKLGEVTKNCNTISSLWWAWFLAGTMTGAILCKIFLSIKHTKKGSISD